jgi:hypothetical protein
MGMWCCFGFRITECGSADIDYWLVDGVARPPDNATGSMRPELLVSGLMKLVIANDWG